MKNKVLSALALSTLFAVGFNSSALGMDPSTSSALEKPFSSQLMSFRGEFKIDKALRTLDDDIVSFENDKTERTGEDYKVFFREKFSTQFKEIEGIIANKDDQLNRYNHEIKELIETSNRNEQKNQNLISRMEIEINFLRNKNLELEERSINYAASARLTQEKLNSALDENTIASNNLVRLTTEFHKQAGERNGIIQDLRQELNLKDNEIEKLRTLNENLHEENNFLSKTLQAVEDGSTKVQAAIKNLKEERRQEERIAEQERAGARLKNNVPSFKSPYESDQYSSRFPQTLEYQIPQSGAPLLNNVKAHRQFIKEKDQEIIKKVSETLKNLGK